jgi:hypothetical protein
MLSSDCTNETLLFSASKQTWLPVYSQEAPTARRGCSLVARGDDRSKSFLFGGQAGTVCMNDLWQVGSSPRTEFISFSSEIHSLICTGTSNVHFSVFEWRNDVDAYASSRPSSSGSLFSCFIFDWSSAHSFCWQAKQSTVSFAQSQAQLNYRISMSDSIIFFYTAFQALRLSIPCV